MDDWVLACVSLYLEFVPPVTRNPRRRFLTRFFLVDSIINLFLQILRLLSDIQDR